MHPFISLSSLSLLLFPFLQSYNIYLYFKTIELLFSPKKFPKESSSQGSWQCPRCSSGQGGAMGMGHVPTGQQWLWGGGQAGGLIPVCVRMCVTAGRVQAQKCGICCHRVFLSQHKLGWQLTQLSPSTCLVQSHSSSALCTHSSAQTQQCSVLTHNFAGDDHAWHLSRLSPCFSPQASSHLLSSPLVSPFLQ